MRCNNGEYIGHRKKLSKYGFEMVKKAVSTNITGFFVVF
jgi:hypothetical protein